jgi:uncharacterized membrane protein YcaP (DUF421 family)
MALEIVRMESLIRVWGVDDHLTPLELAARAAVMFVICLVLVRLSGMRSFGKGNAYDTIITILIGGILSRGVVGATPFLSAVSGGLVIVLMHKFIAWLTVHNKSFSKLVAGKRILLFQDNHFIKDNLDKAHITEDDVLEELHIKVQTGDLSEIEKIYFEKTGEIGFIKKK